MLPMPKPYSFNTSEILCQIFYTSFFKKKKICYLFLERVERRDRGREISLCGYLLCAPYWGPGP